MDQPTHGQVLTATQGAALGRPFETMEGESLTRALFRFRSGVLGGFDAMLTDAPLGPEVLFRITGTRGEITIDDSGRDLDGCHQRFHCPHS